MKKAFLDLLHQRLDLLLAAGIVVVLFLVYAPTLAGQFLVWDDDVNISRNEHVQSLSAGNLKWMFSDVQHALRYKPLSWLAWALIYHFWNLNPLPYHLANLVLHCGNSVLLFFLIQGLLRRWFKMTESRSISLAAAFGTLAWAIHPLRVETVAWITALPYQLSFFFLQVSLLFYLRAQRPGEITSDYRCSLSLSVVAFAASLLSYPIGVGFFLVLLVIDILVLRRFDSPGRIWREKEARHALLEKIPFAFLTAICAAMTLFGRFFAHGTWGQAQGIEQFGLFSRVMQAFYIWAYYFWKFSIPTHLGPAYDTLTYFDPASLPFLLSASFVFAVTITLIWKRQRWRAALALWLCHLILLLPALGLTEHPHYPSDRYGFIPNVTWAFFLAGIAIYLIRLSSKMIFIFGPAIGILLVSGILSFRQGYIWRDTITLLEHTIRIYGTDPHPNNLRLRLGDAYLAQKDFARALRQYRMQVAIEPDNLAARQRLINALLHLGDLDHAEMEFVEILKMAPQDAEMHNRFGGLLAARGNWQQATNQFFQAIELNPGLDSAWANIGRVLQIQGRADEARVYFDKAASVAAEHKSSQR